MSIGTPAQQLDVQLTSDAIERMLRSGESPELLKAYFGDAEYDELRELARRASRRPRRGGPRVLILPGILGSTIGFRGQLFDDTIWLDPVSIIAGDLMKLPVRGAQTRGEALDVIPFLYTKLKLRLWWYGFDVDFHFYDWRRSIDKLGDELFDRIDAEKANKVYLVAHSMGGLVARAALTWETKKVERLIMLGTPNLGSFAAVQVLRGVYETVRKVASFDVRNSVAQLTERVFNTFPSVYQLLPVPDKFDRIDLYKRERWPALLPPRQPLLDKARKVQKNLAQPDERFVLIAANNQATVTDLRLGGDGQFIYVHTNQGDGTVPLDMAVMPDMERVYYADETHNGLVKNRTVAESVRDIVWSGKTDRLASKNRAVQNVRREVRGENDLLKEEPFGGRTGHLVTEAERRSILETLFSPPPIEPRHDRELASDGVVGGPLATQGPALQGVVIGRRRHHRIDVELAHGSIADVDARACVIGLFQNVTPTGPSRVFDDLLEGTVSDLVSRRMFSAGVGEVFILPSGTHRVRPEHLLFCGLGSFELFTGEVQQLVASNVIRTLVRAGIDEFSTVLFGGGSGHESGESLARLIRGFFDGLVDADSHYRFRRIVLCEWDADRYAAMKDQLYLMAGGLLFEDVDVTITEVEIPPSIPAVPSVAARLPGLRDQPVYLTVRQQRTGGGNAKGKAFVHASVLTAGGKATVLTDLHPLDEDGLKKHLDKLSETNLKLDQFGTQLAQLVLSKDFVELLGSKEIRDRHLVVVHDASMSRIPWETIKLGGGFPAADKGMSRRYMADNMAIAKWLEQRRLGRGLDILLVVNPTEDLQGAEAEGKKIEQMLRDVPSISITPRVGPEATRTTLIRDFQSDKYDVIHYAGHAFFDPDDPGRAGIICAGDEVLSGQDLATLGSLPALVFFNACEAARVRRRRERTGKRTPEKPKHPEGKLRNSVGFAEAFLRGGIANFLGTYWPVGDNTALTFAKRFYGDLIRGEPIGSALVEGRKEVKKAGSIDWADYIHYGDAGFRLKIPG